MKEAFPSLLKFLGALAITAAIFFALSPDDAIDDAVLNRSMEFLGARLLAMVPEEQKPHIEKEFDDFREQTRDGKVSDEHVEGIAMAIFNAEAEGKKLHPEQIDSLFAAVENAAEEIESKAERRKELIALGERMQDFAKFEKEWKKMVPLPPLPDSAVHPAIAHRPFYRIKHDFVVEVDSAAIAEIAAEQAGAFADKAVRAIVVEPVEVHQALKELARELPALKIEMGRMKWQIHLADSIRKAIEKKQYEYRYATPPSPPHIPETPKPEKQKPPH